MEKKLYLYHCSYLFGIKWLFLILFLFLFIDLQGQNDTLQQHETSKKISKDALTHTVTYQCTDSIYFDFTKQIAVFFKDSKTQYDDMNLDADYIEIDFKNTELHASGIATEEGEIMGSPVFKQGDGIYRAQEIKYNYNTKKGKISKVITTEGEGFIHGEKVKKVDEVTSFIAHGQYTTCDLDCPHYQIKFNKAKAIQNDKIVTGVAYLSFGDIPTFLAIPFGYFPIQKGRASGLVMPTFGVSQVRGFYLENLGYYFGINNNFDLTLLADIYTRGNWALKGKTNYVYRYKFRGDAFVSFARSYEGEKGTPMYSTGNDFRIAWNHVQDPKSNPYYKFSARINLISKSYTKNFITSVDDYLSNQYNSSINFSTNIKSLFFLDITGSYTQNTQTQMVSLSLPDINMSLNTLYPFRKKGRAGKPKWYENISIKWSSQFSNRVNGVDSTFLQKETLDQMEMGIRHSIPISIPLKIAKLINWNSSINIQEKWYLQSTEKTFSVDTVGDYLSGQIQDHMKRGFFMLHDIYAQTSLNTKIYVLYGFQRGYLKAVRHVLSPDLSFTYRPNLSGNTYGRYYNTIRGTYEEYSHFSGAIFGGVSSQTQAISRFSISNNIEIKVASRKDSITGMKKITLIENLTLSAGYDFAADSLQWSTLDISGRSKFTQFLDLTYSFRFDPYITDAYGRRLNQTEWKVNKKPFRFSSSQVQIGLNWRLNNDFFKGKSTGESQNQLQGGPDLFLENSLGIQSVSADFSSPWNLTINYSFNFNVYENYLYLITDSVPHYKRDIIQTLNLMGDFNVSKKWKVGFTTGYDFKNRQMSYTSFDVYRDLHCWEMRFNWIPFGYRRGWSLTINVKASVLKDLKIPLKQDFRDRTF